MKKIGIYCITNTANGKHCVGQSCFMSIRRNQHFSDLKAGRHRNDHLQKAFARYGASAFEWRVLEEPPENMLDVREAAWIAYYRSNDPKFGYNNESGGCRNKHHSPQTLERLRAAKKGTRPSLLAVQRAREVCLGRKLSPEHIQAIRNHKHTSEELKKMHDALVGRRRTPEQIARIRASHNTPEYLAKAKWEHLGTKNTEETKRKIGDKNRGKKRTPEEIRRMKLAVTGLKRTPEGCANKRAAWARRQKLYGPRGRIVK
jgi:group I intron endonuclease